MKFYRSIRFRLILLYTTLLFLSLTAFGIFGYWRTKRDVIKTVDRVLRSEFLDLGGVHRVDSRKIREFTIETDQKNELGRRPWLYIVVTSPEGEVIARSKNVPGMLASPEGFRRALGSGEHLGVNALWVTRRSLDLS